MHSKTEYSIQSGPYIAFFCFFFVGGHIQLSRVKQIQNSFLSLDAAVNMLIIVPADSRAFEGYQINKQWASIVTMAWLTGGGAVAPPPRPITRYSLDNA